MTDTRDDKTPPVRDIVRDTRPSDFNTPSGVFRHVTKIEKKTNRATVGVVVLGILTALHEAGVLTFLKSILLGR